MIRSSLESKLYILRNRREQNRFTCPSNPASPSRAFPDGHCGCASLFVLLPSSLPNPGHNFPLGFVPGHARSRGLALAGGLYLLDTAEQCGPRAALAGDAAALRKPHWRLAPDLRYRHWPYRRSPAGARRRSGPALSDRRSRRGLPFSSQAAAWLLERMLDLLAVLLLCGYALIRHSAI